jgi:hypothetical protein
LLDPSELIVTCLMTVPVSRLYGVHD